MKAAIDAGSHQSDVARAHGLSRARVHQLLALLELAPEILAEIRSLALGTPPRRVTERKLRALLKLEPHQQLLAFRDMLGTQPNPDTCTLKTV